MICTICQTDHPDPSASRFRSCWIALGGNPKISVTTIESRSTPCTYLGPQTGLRECLTCGNKKTKLKVFECRHPAHIETTWSECQSCTHYADA